MLTESEVVWIVSYPRSGNTWMRWVIANLLLPQEKITDKIVGRVVPDEHQCWPWSRVSSTEWNWRPVFVKSHHLVSAYFRKVIYLYRDVRDVVVSYYYYSLQRRPNLDFDEWLDSFCGNVFPPFVGASWVDHIQLWVFTRNDIPILRIKYEDMQRDLFAQMKKVVEFSKLKVSDDMIRAAIEKTKYSDLFKQRKAEGHHPFDIGLTGSMRTWDGQLTPGRYKKLWSFASDQMEALGYKMGKKK